MSENYGKDSNFKGKKGRSGRKSLQDEHLKALVMKKAWGKVLKRMTKLDDKDIEKLALPIVLRNIPQDVKANVVLNYQPIYGKQSIPGHESNTTNIPTNKENKSSSGGNISE